MAQWLTNPTRNHEVVGLLSGLKIRFCLELLCGLQTAAQILRCCGSGVGRRLQLLDPWPGNLHMPQVRP